MILEKCHICNITTNRFIRHMCRKCARNGIVCIECSNHINSKMHFQTTLVNISDTLWSSGYCTECDKAIIRDSKLEQLGI